MTMSNNQNIVFLPDNQAHSPWRMIDNKTANNCQLNVLIQFESFEFQFDFQYTYGIKCKHFHSQLQNYSDDFFHSGTYLI